MSNEIICPSCGKEITTETHIGHIIPNNSRDTIYVLRCDLCKAFLGVIESADSYEYLRELEQRIEGIEKKLEK